MPIFKAANGKGKYRNLKSKEQVIGYVMNPEKTPHKLYGGAGIDFDNTVGKHKEYLIWLAKLTVRSLVV